MSKLFHTLNLLIFGARQSREELLRENEELKALVRQMQHKDKGVGFQGILLPYKEGIYLRSEQLRRRELVQRWETRLQARIALKASRIQARATLIAGTMTLSTLVFTYLMSRNASKKGENGFFASVGQRVRAYILLSKEDVERLDQGNQRVKEGCRRIQAKLQEMVDGASPQSKERYRRLLLEKPVVESDKASVVEAEKGLDGPSPGCSP